MVNKSVGESNDRQSPVPIDEETATPPAQVAQLWLSPEISEKAKQLQQVLERHRGDRQLVVLQDFPDPDAMSCAWAYKLIAAQYDIECEIIYAGALSHQENIALVKLAGLPVQRWPVDIAKTKDLSEYHGCVLIDNQGTTSQLTTLVKASEIPIVVIIDHHSLQEELNAEFADIRPHIRATATILSQYLQANLLTLDTNNTDHVKCATALMHGLRADTAQLRQAQEEDFLAAAFLSRYYDPQLITSVLQASRSKRVMDVIERSLKNRIVQNSFCIAGVGYLRYDDRDAIPQAADFLVTEENVHTAVVYGIVHDEDEDIELVTGSLRTNKLTLDPDEFLKEAFGQDSHGRFFGGGRSQAGGFEIPMGFLSGTNESKEYAKMKWEVFDIQIKQKLLKLVSPKDDIMTAD
ncbi:DHH family phosphoesterase [Oxynema aestuarii]|uniref:Bifunctional oligoribonuclease/PAP phosphatase NrnA n=1 Tax=Oxynema aestuarii AP17 TaxID=2064643 RepID=A0A6H1U0K9_9CYAN|nr:bifunctional oligoribonuclease/PAP phosphatase NrnA [Oxynema aestuarii]QIZ71976.1 bifunctional oligoribonuclease/PAP phosphatase NrnA [Oxynema aestuarii AP17]RMH72395.1 MAG: bifunctional oligoribonuclease/PAP phosphatase NrnA [Cyanobacteria bacterium J007]